MSKPATLANLSDSLDRDMTWRLREISDMKSSIAKADPIAKQALTRAFIAMLYAHWEGHVRHCAEKYFAHVALRKHPYSKLKRQFYINSFIARLDALHQSKASLLDKCKLVDDVLNSDGKRFSYVPQTLIDTKSNLNSSVLCDICKVCDISFEKFSLETEFIDRIILKRRNEIAHGEQTAPTEEEISDTSDKIINIMRLFRNLLENKAYNKDYICT